MTRRNMLRLGGAAAIATGIGSAFALGGGEANATVPSSKKFVLEGAGGNPVSRAKLHGPNGWAMQAFAFDHLNDHIYFTQHKAPKDPDESRIGDVWITRTDLSGKELGAMAVQKSGHGGALGVEPTGAGSAPILWIEGSDLPPTGHGKKVGVLRYQDGAVIDYVDDADLITDRTPTVSSFGGQPRPAYDPYANRMLIRFLTESGQLRFALFDMDDAKAGNLSDKYRVAERAIPTNEQLGLSGDDTYQGIVPCGQYAYMFFGAANRKSWIVTLDMNDSGGSYVEKFNTDAGAGLPGREAEGCAIWMADGNPRLAYGFSSKTGKDPAKFDASVYYKSDFA